MTIDRSKRKRRLASDEAHAWARSLKLGNPYAKSILKSLALHVDYEGKAFVSIGQLAEDCDLSEDTVRRRLKFLEDTGAIVIFPCWIDNQGRRNTEGRGKRTTDDIRLLVDADPEAIEARAAGENPPEQSDDTASSPSEISPSQQQGLNQAAEEGLAPPLAPPLGVRQPSQSCDHLISEPEPEPLISPQPPSGGAPEEGDDFARFEKAWTEPMTRPSLARQVWASFTPEEKTLVLQATEGYFFHRRQQAKPPHPLGAHIFLKEREAWPKWAAMAKPREAEGVWIAEGSDEDRALRFARWICKGSSPNPWVRPHPAGGPRGYPNPGEVRPDLLAMLPFADQSPLRWPAIAVGSAECAAWRQRLWLWVAGELRPEPGENFIRLPCQWPPSVEGIIYGDDDTSGEASAKPDQSNGGHAA